MPHSELSWPGSTGERLFAQVWQPEGEPKAVLCLVHGLGDHSGRYANLAAVLSGAGYAVLAFDMLGHGRSPGKRGHIPSYDVFMDDIALLLAQGGQRFPERPRFLYGLSMGGNLVLNYALRRRPQLAGVLAMGPWLRTPFEPPAWKVLLGRALNGLWPSFTLSNELNPQVLSRDPAVVQAYIDDPLVHDRISARLGIGTMAAGEWALYHAAEFSLPLLLMHGSADGFTSVEASQQFAERMPQRCTFKRWEGLYHELHNEPEKHEVLTFLIEWLDAHV